MKSEDWAEPEPDVEVPAWEKGWVCGGRRARAREKAGEGKMVRDLQRMFVVVSGCRRCGLNWYLVVVRVLSVRSVRKMGVLSSRECGEVRGEGGFR